MTRHKYTTAVGAAVMVVMLAVTVLFIFGESLGIAVAHTEPPYASTLFATDKVHTLDIVVDEDDWADMLESASAKEYIPVHVVIDGESVKNVGLRTKGNSSLSSIATSDSDRYSFKIEFDHYSTGQSYKGLDKLALNNIAQDNTYLKDYVSYQMMNAFDADAPLSSFIWITVNGEDWGLYLAVEGIEEAFASRNYGSNYGQLYKPDNLDMNDRGDGNGGGFMQMPANENGEDMLQMPEGMELPNFEEGFPAWDGEMPEGIEDMFAQFMQGGDTAAPSAEGESQIEPAARGGFGNMRGGFGGFGANNDVTLTYTDDEYDSYQSIFDNAIFDPTDADKDRLIASIKQMNEGENLEEVVNIEEVLRYFVVHNFVLNFDSYTGSMVHNYYLYEEDGILSMIAWDYNLAFGAFSMGGMGGSGATDSATSAVNYPIDTPVSGATMEDRPLLYQLLSNETYMEQYHALFDEFITEYFESGKFEEMYDNAVALISAYVDKDPTAFCTYEEFLSAQAELKEFCLLRAQSIRGQLDGAISSTSEGQTATGNEGFVDASHIDMSAMGSNMMGFGRARGGNTTRTQPAATDTTDTAAIPETTLAGQSPPDSAGTVSAEGQQFPSDMSGFTPPEGFGEGMQPPGNMGEGMQLPAGMTGGASTPAATGDEQAPSGASAESPTPEAAATQQPTQPQTNQNGGNNTRTQNMWPQASTQTAQAQQEKETITYWLLGASAVLLIIGLIFAAKYGKR